MNLYKYKTTTGYEGHCVANSISSCEKVLNKIKGIKIIKIELLETNIEIQKELEND